MKVGEGIPGLTLYEKVGECIPGLTLYEKVGEGTLDCGSMLGSNNPDLGELFVGEALENYDNSF